MDSFRELPGGALVEAGVRDARAGIDSIESMLVAVGATRLRELGLEVPVRPDTGHRLYPRLAAEFGEDEAHSRYNALVRQLVSFERALECAA